jgi:MFS transporter, DHA1 family, multidrug resistance protein
MTIPNARALTLLLAALTALTSLSIDMSLSAIPQLQEVFQVGVSSAQLTLSLFLLGFALGQVVCGPHAARLRPWNLKRRSRGRDGVDLPRATCEA